MAWRDAEPLPLATKRRLFRDSLLFCLTLGVLAGCAAGPPRAPGGVSLEGRVSFQGSGAEGAEVLLYPADPSASGAPAPVAQTRSGEAGTFRLVAPPGHYVLVARRGELFAYFGRNPVHLAAGQTGLHLPLVPTHPTSRRPTQAGGEAVEGHVLTAGRPTEGAKVFAYLDLGNGLRGPGYAVSEPTGPDGAYRLEVPPGTYFLAARLRPAGRQTGPLEPGDLFGVAPEFPLLLREGQIAAAEVELVELPDREKMARFQGRFATATGLVVDEAGAPVAGFRACLYDNPKMINQPAVTSEPTGPDGRFRLESTLSGTFYLGARERLGRPPVRGERVGFYRGSPGGRVDLSPGSRLSDARIVVQVMP